LVFFYIADEAGVFEHHFGVDDLILPGIADQGAGGIPGDGVIDSILCKE